MAINRIDGPNSTPLAVADYQAQNNLIAALGNGINTVPFSGSNMTIGAVLQVGGTLYRVDTATSITGTSSPYVKITPSGATASASFVASLTGVTWSTVYNGYYDVSGNLYLFDEGIALGAGAISSIQKVYADQPASVLAKLKTVDGAGSGLDADLLDGISLATDTLRKSKVANINSAGVMEVGNVIDFHADDNDGKDYQSRISCGSGVDGNLYINGTVVWTSGNDGAGSGMDADTVDGRHHLPSYDFQDAGNINGNTDTTISAMIPGEIRFLKVQARNTNATAYTHQVRSPVGGTYVGMVLKYLGATPYVGVQEMNAFSVAGNISFASNSINNNNYSSFVITIARVS